MEAEEVLQDEPRVARTLADPAVRDHRLVPRHALRAVQRLQLGWALERAIVVARLRPGDALRAGNMAAALARLGQSWGRKDLPGELLRAPHVHERRALRLEGLLNFRQEGAQR